MLPFSVLRIWGLGVFSWLFLAGGIYLAYRAYDEFEKNQSAPVVITEDIREDRTADDPENDLADREVAVPATSRSNRTAWLFTAGAVALLGWSAFGWLPIHWLLANPTGPQRQSPTRTKEQWVDRPTGARLHVEIFGDDSKPTLLLTHGWSLDRSAWDYVKGDLAKQFRVVIWDLPGLGKSKGPTNRDYSIEAMAHDLEAVLRATATREPVVLASHSIGSMITQTFCRLHPEHLGVTVEGLVFIHATYINPLRTCFASSLATALEAPLITPLNYLTIALAPLAWLSNWQSYLNGSLHMMTRFASFSGKQSWQQLDHGARLAAEAWPATVARGNLAMQKFHEERVLPQIHVPVLVLSGEHDRMTLPSASERIESLLPEDCPYRLDSGHLGFFEQPEDFVRVVAEFMESFNGGSLHRSVDVPVGAVKEKHTA